MKFNEILETLKGKELSEDSSKQLMEAFSTSKAKAIGKEQAATLQKTESLTTELEKVKALNAGLNSKIENFETSIKTTNDELSTKEALIKDLQTQYQPFIEKERADGRKATLGTLIKEDKIDDIVALAKGYGIIDEKTEGAELLRKMTDFTKERKDFLIDVAQPPVAGTTAVNPTAPSTKDDTTPEHVPHAGFVG